MEALDPTLHRHPHVNLPECICCSKLKALRLRGDQWISHEFLEEQILLCAACLGGGVVPFLRARLKRFEARMPSLVEASIEWMELVGKSHKSFQGLFWSMTKVTDLSISLLRAKCEVCCTCGRLSIFRSSTN